MLLKTFTAIPYLFLGILVAATPAPKAGLWEVSVQSTAKGTHIPDGPPMSATAKQCLTSELWARTFGSESAAGLAMIGCKITNEKKSEIHWSMDFTCPERGAQGHQEIDLITPEAVRSNVSTTITLNGATESTSVATSYRFISASCGSIKPAEPLVLPQ